LLLISRVGGHGQIKEGKVMSKTLSVVLVLLLATIGHVWADPLTADMMKLNAQWDAAINDPNFDALLPMYAADASLMPPGSAPVSGPTAIRDFFAKRGTSVRNHKLELVEILPMGDYAYVTSRFKASLVRGEETTMLSGSTVKHFTNTNPTANGRLSPIFSFGNSQGCIIDFLSRPSDHRRAP
jgi:ketosteroid isomerase-like protein